MRPDPASSADPQPSNLRRILGIGDAVAALLAWSIPFGAPDSLLGWHIAHPSVQSYVLTPLALACAVAFTIAVLATERLYLSRVNTMRTIEISRIGRASLVCAVGALIAGKFIGEPHLVRAPLFVGVACFTFLNVWRMGFAMWLKGARRGGRYTRPVLLIGADDEAFALDQHFRRHPELGYRIVGVIGSARQYARHDFSVPWLGETPHLERLLDLTGVNGAIVVGGSLGRAHLNVAVRQLLEHQIHVHMSTGIHGIDHRRIRSQSLAYEPLVYVERADLEGWQIVVKRILDIAISGTMILITSPIMFVAAMIVKKDGGPILFRQERVGRHGELFHMIKFRSMVVDAEARLRELEDQNVRQGPLFKLAVDPRVTKFGRIMRATSIDELPQLFNVLRGDMSLVGPRPALPAEVAKFDEALIARQNVLPGITGLWQVEARDNPDFSVYQRLDIFYVENWSVTLDISILVGTAKVVLVRGLAAFNRHSKRKQDGGASPESAQVLG